MRSSNLLAGVIATWAIGGSSAAQMPAAPAQGANQASAPAPSAVRSYTASGILTNAGRARLKDALGKVAGVEQIEFRALSGNFIVRVVGNAKANAVSMAGMSAGFDFRPAPSRTFNVSGPTAEADAARLRKALQKAEGVEQVDTIGSGAGLTVRVQGEVRVAALVSIAKTAGFDLRRSLLFVASGSPAEKDVSKLREAIGKVAGVEQTVVRRVGGGATLTVQGAMDDEILTAAAKSAGYSLKPLSSSSGIRMFSVNGVKGPEDEENLRKTVQSVSGIGEFQVMTLGDMTRLGIRGGSADPEKVIATAKAAGFDLQPAGKGRGQQNGSAAEQNTPPAFDERVNEDLTKAGDLAPDFELITKEGKGKIRLSDFRGKKPVVLIFGSYT